MSTDTPSEDLIEPARKLFAGPVAFLKSAPDLRFLPEPDAPTTRPITPPKPPLQ